MLDEDSVVAGWLVGGWLVEGLLVAGVKKKRIVCSGDVYALFAIDFVRM